MNKIWTFKIRARMLICILCVCSCSFSAFAQGGKISGNVADDKGEAVIGASVAVKGTTTGTVTDADGNFSLTATPDAVLVISYLGFKTQEVAVGGKTNITVKLSEDTNALDEVVVVGYGTQRKMNLTGSVASVQSKDLTVTPIASVTNMLAGRLPGLISQQSNGLPSADAASLSIRGFGGALVIVDGIEAAFNTIDPNQIESVSILKDGSASIYGSRAGNGVILVTTKRGTEQKPTITLNASYTGQSVTNMPKMANAGQFAEMRTEEWIQSGQPVATAPYSQEQIRKYYAGTDPQYSNTDWLKEVVRDWAPQQQYNLSVRGGSEKIRYYGFLGYMKQETMFKNNGGHYDRYNLQSNIDAQITKDLSFQLDILANSGTSLFSSRTIYQGSSAWQDLWATLPVYPATLPDPTKLSWADGSGSGGFHITTNYELQGAERIKRQDLRGTASLNYNVPFVKGLSAKVFMNYRINFDKNSTFIKNPAYYTYDVTSDTYTQAGGGGNPSLNITQGQGTLLTMQASLNYSRIFAEDHNLSFMALYEGIDSGSESLSAGRAGFMSTAIEQLFAGNASTAINNGSAGEMGRSSVVGRLNYSYKNKYLLESTLRADASAKFAPEKRRGYFPSVSLGWRFSEENFLKDVSLIDQLKLRASYGSMGNDAVGNFQYLAGYAMGNSYLFSSARQAIRTTGLSNPNLTWEEIKLYNAGIDWSLAKRKLYGEADVFYRTREGIPGTRLSTLPSTFGASLPQENLNSVNNRGFELLLGTSQAYGDFTYEISGNISWSREKWGHYEEQDYQDPDEARINKRSGQWTDRRFGYLSNGLFTSREQIDNLPFDQDNRENRSLRPGDVRYVDVNDDKVLDWRDQVEIGQGTAPHWMYGINLLFKYRQFDLVALFQGAFGYSTDVWLYGGNRGNNSATMYDLRWTESNNNPNALVPRLGGSSLNSSASDYRIIDAGYLRLKSFAFGYSLPSGWLSKAGIKQARVYVSGFNLLTFSTLNKYNLDPEMPSGMAGMYYPQQRTVSVGLNVSF